MKDVYQHPTIAALSAAVSPAASASRAGEPGGRAARRDPGRRPAGRQRPGRQTLLRRSGCRFAGDGAVLRPGAEELRPAAGDDQGRLPAPHHCRVERRAGTRGDGAHRTLAPPAVEVAAPVGRLQIAFCGLLQLLIFLAYSYLAAFVAATAFGWISAASGSARDLPAVGIVRRRVVRRRLRTARGGQMGADRPVEAPGDPSLEPAVRPLLDRQDHDPRQSDGLLRRLAALRVLPAAAGGEDRPRRGHPVQDRAGVHRPVDHRVRHGDPQGVVLPGLPRARGSDPDRHDHHRQRRGHRREDRP